ncbi:hypothetical protein Ssi02_56050 [Sinosporangium siamense]|uniref:Abi-like protein n=1 Tax=Sinosporangium siamense TaxID=1367973 RepID=A0A919VEQ9_9ACTN|nr:hypothetical protein Ssi02_56050 [Sinosporangium siamense]
MNTAESLRLRDLLSPTRIAEYEMLCGGQLTRALRLHCWNTEISEAFYGPLQYLELALRTVITREMSALLGQPDWWDNPTADLHFGAAQRIGEARRQLARSGLSGTAEQITDELPFGFWVSLLGSGNTYDQRFWRTGLHRAFPGYRGRRRDLHRKLDYLRILRNKIAHHGAIHHRHLSADHDAVLECLGFIAPELATVVRRYSRVPVVLARRPT